MKKKKPQHASDSDHYKNVSKSELGQTHKGFVRICIEHANIVHFNI